MEFRGLDNSGVVEHAPQTDLRAVLDGFAYVQSHPNLGKIVRLGHIQVDKIDKGAAKDVGFSTASPEELDAEIHLAYDTPPSRRTLQQNAFFMAVRGIMDKITLAHPDALHVGSEVLLAEPPYVQQDQGRACVAANFSSLLEAFGLHVPEAELLAAAPKYGLFGNDGELKRRAFWALQSPAVLDVIKARNPSIGNIAVEARSGYTLADVAEYVSHAQQEGERVYMVAAIASAITDTGTHSVIVRSVGPETTRINDPDPPEKFGGANIQMSTADFGRRFLHARGDSAFIRVTPQG